MVTSAGIFVLDLAAKIDQCAEFLCKAKWGELEFPPPFGRDALPAVGSFYINTSNCKYCKFWKFSQGFYFLETSLKRSFVKIKP